jgi:hypothetical protein
LADAVCGSIYNAISRTKPENNSEIEIHTYDPMRWDREDTEVVRDNLIRAPRMPDYLKDVLDGMEIV